jgi:hypothetical protein
MTTMLRRLALLVGTCCLVPALAAGTVAAGQPEPEPAWANLPVGVAFDYQLGGPSDPAEEVAIVVRDRTAAPADGRYNVCYVNGFQTQPDARRYWRDRWSLVLKKPNGRPVVDGAWGEWLLDLRTARKRTRLARIVGTWTTRCAEDGYDAVEFDNLDSFTRSHGLLRPRHARTFARRLVSRAHDAGLAVAQKNWAEFDGSRIGFDFAVAEECGRWRECDAYEDHYGRRVLVVEYRKRDFIRACEQHGETLSVLLRDVALEPDGRRRWC